MGPLDASKRAHSASHSRLTLRDRVERSRRHAAARSSADEGLWATKLADDSSAASYNLTSGRCWKNARKPRGGEARLDRQFRPTAEPFCSNRHWPPALACSWRQVRGLGLATSTAALWFGSKLMFYLSPFVLFCLKMGEIRPIFTVLVLSNFVPLSRQDSGHPLFLWACLAVLPVLNSGGQFPLCVFLTSYAPPVLSLSLSLSLSNSKVGEDKQDEQDTPTKIRGFRCLVVSCPDCRARQPPVFWQGDGGACEAWAGRASYDLFVGGSLAKDAVEADVAPRRNVAA